MGAPYPEPVVDRMNTGRGIRSRPVPYNVAQLVDAISLDYESGYKGRGDLEITFDDDALKNPEQCACRGPDEVGRLGQRRGRCSRRCRPG